MILLVVVVAFLQAGQGGVLGDLGGLVAHLEAAGEQGLDHLVVVPGSLKFK